MEIHLHDGNIVDASLTPATRQFFEKISSKLPLDGSDAAKESKPADSTPTETVEEATPAPSQALTIANRAGKGYDTIEVPLVSDGVFFDILQNDVSSLDALQATERDQLKEEVKDLGKQVSHVARPGRFSKSDLDRWRRIFELYLDAEVFFATHERDHGARSSQKALQQLQWFQNQVQKQELVKSFKRPESRAAFSKFLELNLNLLKHLQFQELNLLAITKILKSKNALPFFFAPWLESEADECCTEFDKRTALGVSRAFPSAISSRKLLSGDIAKEVCARISDELVSIIPQVNDYLCPICYAIAYQPVRLDCQHVFCIRCSVKLQRRHEEYCPLCRARVVMDASASEFVL